MDILDRLIATLKGGSALSDDPTPREVLRHIVESMEEQREVGFDNRVYVPNRIEITIGSPDEQRRRRYLAFITPDALKPALEEVCRQRQRTIRGKLQIQVKVQQDEQDAAAIQVCCSYAAEENAPAHNRQEDHTVAAPFLDPEGTVAALFPLIQVMVTHSTGAAQTLSFQKLPITIGRQAGCDIVLQEDRQVSRSHASIEQAPSGCLTVRDCGSRNGTRVNGEMVERRDLKPGDRIQIGAATLQIKGDALPLPAALQGAFGGAAAREASGSGPMPPQRILRPAADALVLLSETGTEEKRFLLASSNLIGRSPTCDIVLPHRSVAMRHARIERGSGGFLLERLEEHAPVLHNGTLLDAAAPAALHAGDMLQIGELSIRYEKGE